MAGTNVRPSLRMSGPRQSHSSSVSAWSGQTTLASGSISRTVSTPLIQNNALVLMGTRPSSIGLAHNSGSSIVVTSIVAGVSFAFARAAGTPVPWDEVVSWELVITTTKPIH